jgi:anti-sigma-K factor RskA
VGEAAARRIDADLQRYPLVLKENKALRTANAARQAEATQLRTALVAKDTVLAATERRVSYNATLYRDADARAAVWKAKARKRSWLLAALSAVLAAVTYTAVAR